MALLRRTIWWVPPFIVANDVLCSAHRVEGDSMAPALNPGAGARDVVLADRLAPRLHHLARGDVVLLRSPADPNRTLVKRLLALEGDWVSVGRAGAAEVMRVPKGGCWVEGDNRGCGSEDSASAFGPVPLALVEARVAAVAWPPARWGRVPRAPQPHRVARGAPVRRDRLPTWSDWWG